MKPLPLLEGGSTKGKDVIVTVGEKTVIQKGPPPLEADGKRKDGFSNKLQIPEFSGKKEHPTDVAEAF